MEEIRTEQAIYTGHVQGVGFRYTVRTLARRHPVSGYVRNLDDGSVELVARGAPGAINSLMADVAEQFRGNIRGCQRREVTVAEPLSGFEIRF